MANFLFTRMVKGRDVLLRNIKVIENEEGECAPVIPNLDDLMFLFVGGVSLADVTWNSETKTWSPTVSDN